MEISGSTKLTCLLGSPVAHSISPAMHNTAFQALDLDYTYMAFDVAPENLFKVLDGLKLINCRGFNLTMPLKTHIIPYLDEISQASELCHAVNTVVLEDGKMIGTTTDGIGYMDSLRDKGFHIEGSTMTLLGAGGAATAICTQAAIDGVKKINLFKRKNASFSQTVSFADMISSKTSCQVSVIPMDDTSALRESIAESAILTNATNVGMGDDDTSLVPIDYLRPDLLVSDIIYHPSKTKLLSDAESIGCKIINGKYMLLYQGAASFQIWTGKQMPIDLVKKKCFSQD